MAGSDLAKLDRAVALFLVDQSSGNALCMVREARAMVIRSGPDGPMIEEAVGLHSDCLMLHDAILTLESDPEIVKRNMIARVIAGIFPLLNTIEEYRSFEDTAPLDMLMNGLGIVSELSQATMYLEGTKISANAHSERALLRVEERLVELAANGGGDIEEKMVSIQDFMDDVRRLDVAPRERPLIPFLFWTFITVISYRRLKDDLRA